MPRAATQLARVKSRWIVAVLLLIAAASAGYMAWLSWHTRSDGKWLFGMFAVFLLSLGVSTFLPKSKRPPPLDAAPTGTRFVPHWFILLALLLFAAGILLAIVGAILHH